jgi:hypothetical protein
MKLGIVTCFFNPCGYERPQQNLVRYLNHLGGAVERLHLICLKFDGQEFPDFSGVVASAGQFRVRGIEGSRPGHFLWQKERLLSEAIRTMPAEYDAVAWVDADILFYDSGWVEQAELMLQEFGVIQLFSQCHHMNAGSGIEQTRLALAKRYDPHGSCWGMAWAARREIVADGLLDWCITGAGDAFMADAWLGHRRPISRMSAPMARLYRPWAEQQAKLTGGKVGFLPGDITHLWHGTMMNRRYQHRNRLLTRYNFDPATDLVADGPLYRWANPDSPLARAVMDWFGDRREDG